MHLAVPLKYFMPHRAVEVQVRFGSMIHARAFLRKASAVLMGAADTFNAGLLWRDTGESEDNMLWHKSTFLEC